MFEKKGGKGEEERKIGVIKRETILFLFLCLIKSAKIGKNFLKYQGGGRFFRLDIIYSLAIRRKLKKKRKKKEKKVHYIYSHLY